MSWEVFPFLFSEESMQDQFYLVSIQQNIPVISSGTRNSFFLSLESFKLCIQFINFLCFPVAFFLLIRGFTIVTFFSRLLVGLFGSLSNLRWKLRLLFLDFSSFLILIQAFSVLAFPLRTTSAACHKFLSVISYFIWFILFSNFLIKFSLIIAYLEVI